MNFDVPHDSEDYVHRIGRTARAQRDGKAITLVRGREISDFMQIENFLGYAVDKVALPEGLGEAPEYKPMKSSHRGGRRHGTSGRVHGGHQHSARGRHKEKTKKSQSALDQSEKSKKRRHHGANRKPSSE